MSLWKRKRIFRARKCPHVHLQSLHGAVKEALGGYNLQCTDCWTFLAGPAELSLVDRDPARLVSSQNDWFLGKALDQ